MRTVGAKNIQYKIRHLTKNNKTGDAFGITIPHEVASQFKACFFTIYIEDNKIILNSGCDIKEQGKKETFADNIISEEKVLNMKNVKRRMS